MNELKTKGIPVKEKLAYSLGMLGTNMTYGLTSAYLLIYYTDVYTIPALSVSLLIFISRLWDAVNDPLMGLITDRTRTRWGKFRPYILIAGLLMAVFTTMMFFSPELTGSSKIIYAYFAYIGWDLAYTMSDIPKWSMTSVMTSDKNERVSLISWAKIFGMLGNIGANIAVIPLVNYFGKMGSVAGEVNYVMGYRNMAIVVSVIVFAASILMFFGTKERITSPPDQKTTLRDSLKSIFKNKPLLMLLISLLVVNSVSGISGALQIHYIKYNLGNENLVPIISVIVIVPTLLGAGISGALSRKIGKKRLFIIAMSFYVLRGVVQYFVGYQSVVAIIVLFCVTGLFLGMVNVIQIAMLTDTIDYAERLTGNRNEGTVFSTQTFIVKLSGAIGGSVAALALVAVGYIENVPQSVETLNGIHLFMTLIPAAAGLLAIIPISFYNASENKNSSSLLENISSLSED